MHKELENHYDGVTPDLIERLSGPVGFVTLNWPFIEETMAYITEITADAVQAAGLRVKRERSFKERFNYMRRIFTSVPALASHAKFFEQIAADIDQLTPVRHALTHGRMTSFDSETEIVRFIKINPDRAGQYHIVDTIKLSPEVIDNAGRVSLLIVTNLGRLARALLAEDLTARAETVGGGKVTQ